MPLGELSIVKEAVERKRRSLYNSVIDGMAFSVMVGFGEAMIIPFALALRATPLQVGVLATLPIFLGALVQLAGAKLLSMLRSRKKIILPFVFLQACTWLLIAGAPFAFGLNVVWLVIALFCVYYMFGQVVSPVWNSLMADLVNVKERGKYFGKRTALTSLTAMSAALAAGFFLQLYPAQFLLFGFATLFVIAMVYRLVSLFFLKKMHEPRYIWQEEKETGFFDFLRHAKRTNFGRFVLFVGAMNFAVFVASPFFTPYMLETLGFGYLLFTLVNSIATLASIITIRRWGANIDIFGNRNVLALTSFLVCFVPLLWVVSPDPLYILMIQLFSGFAWAGFNLAVANFAYDSLEPGKIARFLAYQNIVIGVATLGGGLVGSALIEYTGMRFLGSAYLFVFLASTGLRLAAMAFFMPLVKEVRQVQPITERQLFFKMVTIRPIHGAVHEIIVLGKKLGGETKAQLKFK